MFFAVHEAERCVKDHFTISQNDCLTPRKRFRYIKRIVISIFENQRIMSCNSTISKEE